MSVQTLLGGLAALGVLAGAVLAGAVIATAWRWTRLVRLRGPRDPRQARFFTWASVRWIVRHRAWTPWYLLRYGRFLLFRIRNPHVVTEGLVFLGRHVDLYARPGYGRLILGRWVHLGNGNAIRCHEGQLRLGDKVVFGKDSTVNCYLDIEIGAATIVADWVYICDFDHVFADPGVPIKDQGIVKSPVRIAADVWVGTKATILRGVRVGRGSVLAAHALVNGDIPEYAVAVGVPARVVRDRQLDFTANRAHREALADMARKAREAARGAGEAAGSAAEAARGTGEVAGSAGEVGGVRERPA